MNIRIKGNKAQMEAAIRKLVKDGYKVVDSWTAIAGCEYVVVVEAV